jgi:hypothetical protein
MNVISPISGAGGSAQATGDLVFEAGSLTEQTFDGQVCLCKNKKVSSIRDCYIVITRLKQSLVKGYPPGEQGRTLATVREMSYADARYHRHWAIPV